MPKSRPAPLTRSDHPPSLTGMSDLVMVVEDEKEIRDLIRYNLERADFRVAAFADGEEGLKQLFAERPAALVLDLKARPGVDKVNFAVK